MFEIFPRYEYLLPKRIILQVVGIILKFVGAILINLEQILH
jgi:hypothetical protein